MVSHRNVTTVVLAADGGRNVVKNEGKEENYERRID
jgi:hypothetical protein